MNLDKAKRLLAEYEKGHWLWIPAQMANFAYRLRRLYDGLDPKKDYLALLQLDIISTRSGIDLEGGKE